MMRDIHVVLGLLVIVDSIDHFTGRIGVIGAAALLQLFWFHLQIRVFIQLKQLFFDLLHHLGAGAAFVILAHFDGQHLFWFKVVEQIGARNQAQRADQPFAER